MTEIDTEVQYGWQPAFATAVQCNAWVDDPVAGWRECKNRTTRPSGQCRVHDGQEFPG